MTISMRRQRERDIVDATKALFDQRGLQDAPVEEIARAVGINKALIYRHFASKDELFVVTVLRYVAELSASLHEIDATLEPRERLLECAGRFTDYCLAHPAFLDCCMSLMRRSANELVETVSESVLAELGQGMAEAMDVVADVLRDGVERGVFSIEDPDLTANVMWTKALGVLHLARLGAGVRRSDDGTAGFFRITPEQVRAACLADALSTVGAQP